MSSPAQSLEELAARIEAAIFAAGGTGFTARLRRVLDISPGQLDALVEQINGVLAEQGRPYEITAVAGGFQFRTRPEWSEFLAELQPERKQRLSPAALDTLAVIAYRQPITRAELEELRSVDCDGVLRSLIERRFVRLVGRRDAPGRPALYGTTPFFLEAFGMRALHELPVLRDLAAEEAGAGTAVALDGAAAPVAGEPGDPGASAIEDAPGDLEAAAEGDSGEPAELGAELEAELAAAAIPADPAAADPDPAPEPSAPDDPEEEPGGPAPLSSD